MSSKEKRLKIVLEYIQQLKKNSAETLTSSERPGRLPPREKKGSGTGVVPPEPAHPAPQTPAVIADQEVRSRWGEFVQEVRVRRISLGSVLETSRFRGVEGNTIVIGCPAEFQLSSIKRNREALAKIFESLFHVTV